MPKPAKRRLIEAALQAQQCAVAPYSGFKVGAALLAQNGKVFSGVNVESVSFGLTCCAERVALFKALSEGERQFAAVAIVTPSVAYGQRSIDANLFRPALDGYGIFSIERAEKGVAA